MAQPSYVRRGGLDVSPPPFRCDSIGATIFYVDATPGALQAICDRTLNAPSGPDSAQAGQTRLKYRPLVSWVALTFQTFAGMRSVGAPDAGSTLREWHSYSEASFWVMVVASNGLELLIPYMFIDDGVMMAAGREIYGFPKEHAAITLPPAEDAAQSRFAVDALAVAAASVNPAATQRPILECVARGTAPVSLAGAGHALEQLIAKPGALHLMSTLVQELATPDLEFVFLRQFRALGGGSGAELQQVVGATAKPFSLGWPHTLLLDYELRLTALASHPIAADFGFAGPVVDVPLGFQCNMSFILQPGRVL